MQVVVGAIKNLRIHPLQKQMLAFSDSGHVQERNRLQQVQIPDEAYSASPQIAEKSTTKYW